MNIALITSIIVKLFGEAEDIDSFAPDTNLIARFFNNEGIAQVDDREILFFGVMAHRNTPKKRRIMLPDRWIPLIEKPNAFLATALHLLLFAGKGFYGTIGNAFKAIFRAHKAQFGIEELHDLGAFRQNAKKILNLSILTPFVSRRIAQKALENSCIYDEEKKSIEFLPSEELPDFEPEEAEFYKECLEPSFYRNQMMVDEWSKDQETFGMTLGKKPDDPLLARREQISKELQTVSLIAPATKYEPLFAEKIDFSSLVFSSARPGLVPTKTYAMNVEHLPALNTESLVFKNGAFFLRLKEPLTEDKEWFFK